MYEVKYIPEENEHCWQTPKAEEIHMHNNINKLDVLKRNFLGCNIEKLKRCGKVSAQDGVKNALTINCKYKHYPYPLDLKGRVI